MTLKLLSLDKQQADAIATRFRYAGYTANPRQEYTSFSKGRGDKTYLHCSRNVIRVTVGTRGDEIIRAMFGAPNGKASDLQNDKYSTWFFNGYAGKAGSRVD
jgi:hypothetical protein